MAFTTKKGPKSKLIPGPVGKKLKYLSEEEDKPNYVKVAVVVGVICLISAVVHEHKDKRKFSDVSTNYW